jgi:hypothetical protein
MTNVRAKPEPRTVVKSQKPVDLFSLAMEAHLRVDALEKKMGLPQSAGGSAAASGGISAPMTQLMTEFRTTMAQRSARSEALIDALTKQTMATIALLTELRSRKVIQ